MEGLPAMFESCEIGQFDDEATNASILRAEHALVPVRVVLTMLRKLYRQRGGGRKQKALSRGMDQAAQAFVPRLLTLLRSEHLTFNTVAQGEPLWHPVHGQRRRVNAMLESAGTSTDPLFAKARLL